MIGGLAGIGAVIYARALKKLDLRIEVRRANNNAVVSFKRLREAREYAIKSRQRVAAATGTLKSGTMIRWEAKLLDDLDTIKKISDILPKNREIIKDHSTKKLEEQLEGYELAQAFIDALQADYDDEIRRDDVERDQIREDMRAQKALI